jgi:anti-sigma factor RsiW
MNRDTQLQVQAYLDNELSPADARNISELISSDAQARELYSELKDTKELLVHNEPEVALPEAREFYWSQIQRRIEAAEKTAQRPPVAASIRPWWLRILAPVAGTVALFAVLLSVVNQNQNQDPSAAPVTLTQSAAAPLHQLEQTSDVSTITFRSDTEGVTVVWITSAQ